MSRTLSRGQSVLLGATVLVAVGLGAGGLFFINDRAGWSSQSFRAEVGFPDINGVEVGSRVRIQGIDAGEVEAVVPPERPGEPVKLRLRLARKVHHLVGADARVQIVSENLVGGKLVRILPGAAQTERIADGGELTPLVQADAFEQIATAASRLNLVLAEVDGALQAIRKRDGAVGVTTRDLTESAAKLNSVLGKAEAALARVEKGQGTLGKLLQDESLYQELTTTVARVRVAMDDLESGQGTLGRLVKSNEAYSEALSSLQDVRRMVTSVKQNADALKTLPLVRSYVVDPHKELARPDCRRLRRAFAEKEVFEPGRAVLTPEGRKLLDETALWLNEHKEEGSEVVVAAFAAPGGNADFAQTLTQKQSDVAVEYLKAQHRIQRTGWWWWSARAVRPVGCGLNASPVPETETLPPARLEVIVFIPT